MDRHPLQDRPIFNANDNVMPRKTSAIVQPVKKENQEARSLFLSPVLPGTGSISHNVTRLLAVKDDNSGRTSPQETVNYLGQYAFTSRQGLFTTPKGNSSTTSDGKRLLLCFIHGLTDLFCRFYVFHWNHKIEPLLSA